MAVRALTAELEAIAKRDLNEDPRRLEQDLKHITDWLAKQPHLHARTDSQWLTTFLRGCKFSLERTKSKMEMFYTLKTALPEFFSNRDPMLPEIQYILKLGILLPLPQPDDHGRRVVLMRNGGYDPDKVKATDVFKVNLMISDILIEEDDRTTICGTSNVMDHAHTTLAHLTQFSPFLVKKATTIFQDGYPSRPKGMHHVHMNSAVVTVFNMFKSFMNDKMKSRIHVHADLDSLYKQVPKKVLPQEYGGDAGPMDKIIEHWKQRVEARRSWLMEGEKYRSDEKKRPGGKPKTQEDLFGLDGSFRQLNVD